MASVLIQSSYGFTAPQIVATSAGTLYVFDLYIGQSLRWWKSTDGSSWAEQTAQTSTQMFGGPVFYDSFDCQIDSNNIIHFVATTRSWTETSRDIAYATLTTSTDTWSSWTAAITNQTTDNTSSHNIKMALDANNKVHFIANNQHGDVIYVNNVSGWSTPYELATVGSNTEPPVFITVWGTDTVEVAYSTNNTYPSPIHTKTCSGGIWTEDITWDDGVVYIGNIIYDESTVFRYGGWSSGNPDWDTKWYINNVDIESGLNPLWSPDLYHNGLFYSIVSYSSASAVMISTDGINWSGPYVIPGSTAPAGIVLRKQYFNRYDNGKIDFVFSNGSSSYWDYTNEPQFTNTAKSAYISGTATLLTPDTDITDNNWINETGGTNLYASLADTSDATYVWSDGCVQGDYFEVGLSNPTGTISGAHTLFWKAYKKAGVKTSVTLKCELKQGTSTVITSDTQVISSGTAKEFNKSLTAEEISTITDYTDLRIRITVMAVT